MPAQEIDGSNPPADASLLPDSLLSLSVKLDLNGVLSPEELKAAQNFRRVANYIAAGEEPALFQAFTTF